MKTMTDTLFKMFQRNSTGKETSELQKASPEDLGLFFIYAAYIESAYEFLKEQIWLNSNHGLNRTFSNLLAKFFSSELSQIGFFEEYMTARGADRINDDIKMASDIRAEAIDLAVHLDNPSRKVFAMTALMKMREIFLSEESLQQGLQSGDGHKGPRLYRTFEQLDQVFGLDYNLDKEMVIDHLASERLYQGSGVMVQSGYSTILLALHNTEIRPGIKVVDLGSGYGRVGLVFSLLHPEMKFTGYEYVQHRVVTANRTSTDFELSHCLQFITQDLSLKSFTVPEADVYYMYDPFTDETYDKVLNEILAVSKKRDITVITKGNARSQLDKLALQSRWLPTQILDEGNLCIFRSGNSDSR